MIKLEKGVEPAILLKKGDQWTQAVLARIAAGEAPTRTERSRYNHSEIKSALMAETHGKCAYCESKFRHVTYGDIEHVVPKSSNPSRWFSWANLTIACDVCNTNKGEAQVDEETFIDPYEVDPEEHFWHIGSMVQARPGCDRASLTERLLDLNRADLVERRAERIAHLIALLEVVERCESHDLKDLLWREFALEAQAHNEYAALSRSVVALARAKLRPNDSDPQDGP